MMFRKEQLEDAIVVFSGHATVMLSNGRHISVRLLDGYSFDEDSFRLDDGNQAGEKALRELVKEKLFS